eukprot:TRINITY_DN14728_c0_g1_i1.p1 TRINITY_DN14728_c0_g1~~TRINITY_DN14728_c0_g1_i1.p1  ORF type:complete len:286 (-),score=49.63 TRINITY_DN14728_c0_g1_i1:201-1025(-)
MAEMEAAMNLVRRMPPTKSQQTLDSLLALLPAFSSDLLSRVDQPLEEAWDEGHGKTFLLCDYNRDGDSYRSPWSSKYFPPLDDGAQPSAALRKLEQDANDVFAIYRDQYYEGGSSSVYAWEPQDGEGFAACFLIKKDGSQSGQGRRGLLQHGLWDAIHVIEVGVELDSPCHYCLTSTVMLSLSTGDAVQASDNGIKAFALSGSITRRVEADMPLGQGHVSNMGKMIEEMESKLRNVLDQVYFGKTKELVFTLHTSGKPSPAASLAQVFASRLRH